MLGDIQSDKMKIMLGIRLWTFEICRSSEPLTVFNTHNDIYEDILKKTQDSLNDILEVQIFDPIFKIVIGIQL